jgi:hypothetical protein
MVVADRLRARCLQEAIHRPVRVVIQLDLPHPELIGSVGAGSLGDFEDRLSRQLQIRMEVHELRHTFTPGPLAPPGGRLSDPNPKLILSQLPTVSRPA